MKALVTGAAGFIGSHLVGELIAQGHQVLAVDDLSTGKLENLKPFANQHDRFAFLRIRAEEVRFNEQDVVFHLAALGSVPRSIDDPRRTHDANMNGFFNVIHQAQRAGVERFVYASSSSVYGGAKSGIRKVGGPTGPVRSPYAATKRANEIYAEAFSAAYGMRTLGMRFFNVYGPRQNPDGDYAAVVPKWIKAGVTGRPIVVNGDGLTVRDFTYVDDVVQALLAAGTLEDAPTGVYNVGTGRGTSLLDLRALIGRFAGPSPVSFGVSRPGDVAYSVAEISDTTAALGWRPSVTIEQGIERTIAAYRTPRV